MKKLQRLNSRKIAVLSAAIILALGAAVDHYYGLPSSDLSIISSAHAEGDNEGGSGGHKGGKGVKGDHGDEHGSGGEKGQRDVLNKGPEGHGDYSADGKGPRAKSGESGAHGTKPVWASEGVTTELGRLNVVRAPQSMRDRQLAEALASDPTLFDVYNLSIADFTSQLTKDTERLDAPVANLAMYQAFIKALAADPTATSVTISSVNKETGDPVSHTFDLTGSATATSVLGIMLGTATDKDPSKIGGVTTEVVESVNKILGLSNDFNSAGLDASAVGSAAEEVRNTINTVHEQ